MKIAIAATGKLKSKSIAEIVSDYAARISHYLPFEITECRDEKQALSKLAPNDFFVVLDERGKEKSSKELAAFISEHQLRGTKRLVFFIGGPDGVGSEILARANLKLGLSKMTFPHELVQAIIAEQLYRALSILRGEPYHRE